jgi:hypothetical protein
VTERPGAPPEAAGVELDKKPCANSVRAAFLNLFATLGDRLTAGQRILAPLIKVRILVPQLFARDMRRRYFAACVTRGPHRLAVRTPASHVGNTGSIPVGVATAFASENAKIEDSAAEMMEPVTEPIGLGTSLVGRGGRGSPMRRASDPPESTGPAPGRQAMRCRRFVRTFSSSVTEIAMPVLRVCRSGSQRATS